MNKHKLFLLILLTMSLNFILGSGCNDDNSAEIVCPTDYKPEIPTTPQKTGFLKVPNGNIFYWLKESPESASTKPLVIWLNGGPGSSSLTGLFLENGPEMFMNGEFKLTSNPNAWNKLANVLYIEQPPGTGYSKADTNNPVMNQTEASQDLLKGILAFYGTDDGKAYKGKPLYITGESFAGTYIPWTSKAILDYNAKSTTKDEDKIPLKGIAIGDGTVDNFFAWKTMPQFAAANKLITADQQKELEQNYWPACKAELGDQSQSTRKPGPIKSCWGMMQQIRNIKQTNVYDIRVKEDYNLSNISCYLNSDEMKSFLKIPDGTQWADGNKAVFGHLNTDDSVPTTSELKEILANNLKVIIYSGDQDLIINHMGTEAWLENFDWPNKDGFNSATLAKWPSAQSNLGLSKSFENLTYILVNKAGHLLPMDQPVAALKILEQLIQ